jgi:hypothetical protein
MKRLITTSALVMALALVFAFLYHERPTEARALMAQAPPVQTTLSLPPPNPQRNVYFGDLHLHTSMSLDAATVKTTTLPEDSYRFAQGEEVLYLGHKIRRHATLDFLAVTDHAEYLGVVRLAADPKGLFANTEWPKLLAATEWKEVSAVFGRLAGSAFMGRGPIPEFMREDLFRSNWQREIDAAEKYYRPGKFTTFVAYEWSATPNSYHLHRNVIFRGPKYPDRPFSALDSMKPEDLWRWAENHRAHGIDSVLIPHNPNLSGGLVFAYTDSYGNPISREYAVTRMRNEPLIEITQSKGTSETRPELSPTDEFADFELMKPHGPVDGSYVRQGLGRGLEIRSRVGVNPFKYGLEGGSDFHSGISASEENNFPGGYGLDDDNLDNPQKVFTERHQPLDDMMVVISASGLTGVWAEQNTRESIFDALRRKEAFATSGTRIALRFFAGWDYPAGLVKKADWIQQAYAHGVSMGADLPPHSPSAKSPRFLVYAVKDPETGNLDRIQIVKVWLNDGHSQERIFDVVGSGSRKPDPKTGKLPPVGNTVDLKTATYTNLIGAAELIGEWTDPEFNSAEPAIYYARVLEIPTPRWSTYTAVRNHLPLPERVSPTIQERAWASPIFYQP